MEFSAAVLHTMGAPLCMERVTLTGLERGDVLVRIRASGLCHTDLEVIEGRIEHPMPVILGHEGAGIVEAVGDGVTEVVPGDHVVCSWNPHCGHCYYCARDLPILCEPFTRHQPAGRLPDGHSRYALRGEPVHHFSAVSSHAEFCVVPESGAVRVPRELPFDRACLIGCGVMTGVGAVARLARVEAGATVAVIGCGAVGLNCLQGAVIQRAETIIAIDTDTAKLGTAKRFGATHSMLVDAQALDAVKALTAGRGTDYVFECAGSQRSLELMLELVRPGGQAVILGKTRPGDRVSLRFGSLMGEKRIVRSSYGGARPRRDFPWLAKLYLEGTLKLDELITRRMRLEDINEGFAAMTRGEVVRAVMEMPG